MNYIINLMLILLIIMMMLIYSMNKLNMKLMKMNFFNSIECGFNQMNNKHISLSNNFFFILMIFLIFDMEFFMLIPLMLMIKNFNWMKFNLIMIIIIMFIYLSMIYEIKMNSINWIK